MDHMSNFVDRLNRFSM